VNNSSLVVGSNGLYQCSLKCLALSEWKETINSTKYTTQLCLAYLSSFAVIQLSGVTFGVKGDEMSGV